MKKLEEINVVNEEDNLIEKMMGELDNLDDACSKNNLIIQNNISSIKITNLGGDNDYNPGF